MERRVDVKGFENRYMVSDKGCIKSKSCTIIVTRKKRGSGEVFTGPIRLRGKNLLLTNHKGYKRVRMLGKSFLVHRIVRSSFNNISLKDMCNKVVMHINDNPSDNRLQNLALGNQSDNVADCFNKGRMRWVVKPPEERKGKLVYGDIALIFEDYTKTKSIYKTGARFGVSGATISRIINKRIWH